MTLIKSLLLGSAAGLVAVSAAQAADLPTRKGPVAAEYVRVCSITVAGVPVVGFVLPGSDTCFKISGYITGQVEGGNVSEGYTNNYVDGTPTLTTATKDIAAGAYNGVAGKQIIPSSYLTNQPTTYVGPRLVGGAPDMIRGAKLLGNNLSYGDGTSSSTVLGAHPFQAAWVDSNHVYAGQQYWKQSQYAGQQKIASPAAARDSFGFTTRFNLTFDAVSNTAYGPLVAHGEYQFNHGEGFDNTGQGGSDGGLNRAYVTWAGLTAGKIDSFFSFTNGGLAWANFFSPDRKGFNQPDVLAYTASFGGGFSATLSLESTGGVGTSTPVPNTATSGGSETGYLDSATQNGHRFPDIVGALSVKQAWGTAQVSGVAHNVRAASTMGDGSNIDKWGFAVDAGVQFNIPNLAGSFIGVTGAWSQNATWYSGMGPGEMMWGEGGAVNGNGQAMPLGDAFSNGDGTWATPTAWSVTAYAQMQVNPQVSLGLEGSYGQIHWSGNHAVGNAALSSINQYSVLAGPGYFTPGGSVLSDSESWLIGGIAHYDPVKNLDFEFELLYQASHTAKPAGYIAGDGVNTTTSWHGNSDGFAARFEVTRSF